METGAANQPQANSRFGNRRYPILIFLRVEVFIDREVRRRAFYKHKGIYSAQELNPPKKWRIIQIGAGKFNGFYEELRLCTLFVKRPRTGNLL